jgi:hypothetical protein
MNMCTAQWKRNNTLTGVKQAFHRNVRQLHRNDVADCRTVDVSLPISIPDGRNLSQSGIRRLTARVLPTSRAIAIPIF